MCGCIKFFSRRPKNRARQMEQPKGNITMTIMEPPQAETDRPRTPSPSSSIGRTGDAQEDDGVKSLASDEQRGDLDQWELSFRMPGEDIGNDSESIEEKCAWLRSRMEQPKGNITMTIMERPQAETDRPRTPSPSLSIGRTGDAQEDDDVKSLASDEQRGDLDQWEVSFRMPGEDIGNDSESIEEKCAWLRSQLVGDDVEFDAPFGKRRLTYADHAASGRCLHHVENYIVDNVLPFYGNTQTDDNFVGHRTMKMVHEAAKYIKSCLGGGPDDALLFCGSGTTAAIKRLQEVVGISIASTMRSRVVKNLRLEERWVVFVGPYEHHSNLLSWRQSLAEVVEIGVDGDGLLDIDILRRELQSPKYSKRPMLGSFSACSNVTGIYTNTRAVARLLHKHGAFACFDFSASGPYMKIDMRSGELEGYDAVFLSPHKFVGGPGTSGILLMSKALYYLRSSSPSTCGGGTVCFANGFSEKDTLYNNDVEKREDAGTPAIVQKIRAALAFWVKEHMGYHLIETQQSLWRERAMNRLLQNPNVEVLGNTSVKRQPIISFLVYTTSLDLGEKGSNIYMWKERTSKKDKPLHGRFVTKLLNDVFGIQAHGGCACAGPYGHLLLNVSKEQSLAFHSAIQKGYNGLKPGWTRISFCYYMSITEFEFILAALEFVALYGQRFLPLYHFNWKTGDWTFKKSGLKNIVGEEQALAIDKLKLRGKVLHNHHHHHDPRHELESPVETISPSHSTHQSHNGSMEYKYESYLEMAHFIANTLPKFPMERRVPEEIDLDLILFRI